MRSVDALPMRLQSGPPDALQVPIEPDAARAADQIRLGHEAPDPAVGGIVAVVADHQVVARGNLHLRELREVAAVGHRFGPDPPGLVADVATIDAPVAARQGGATMPNAERQDSVRCTCSPRCSSVSVHVLVAAVVVPAQRLASPPVRR